ncbi:hypothetical protein EAH87_07410 [Sphingomonas koreensis]|nr:hypothetical protein EAH87_07410 [Sphingomonas koreensis]
MRDFIMLMHRDTTTAPAPDRWPAYFAVLRERGAFVGGSAIGAGQCFRQNAAPAAASAGIGGYIRIRADTIAAAQALLAGNPVFECGGTVEIRELPQD